MKKFLLLSALVVAVTASASRATADIIFFEDFNSGGTGVFSVTALNDVRWDDMSVTSNGNYTGGTGNAMTADSDFVGPVGAFDTRATASVNAVGYGSLTLSYLVNFQKFGANGSNSLPDADRLEVYAGGVLVDEIAADTGGFFVTPGVLRIIGLSSLLDNSVFDIEFRYVDEDSSAWEWYAQVDDVVVEGILQIPEPSSLGIFGLLAGCLLMRRRK